MYFNLDRRPILLLILFSMVCISACNYKRRVIPISGQVRIDGKPLETGTITVWVKDFRPAIGVIGKDGRFTLMTHAPGDGCVMGEHDVTVSSRKSVDGIYARYFIPKRYDDPTQSKLKINVTKPDDNWNVELTWTGDPHKGPFQE